MSYEYKNADKNHRCFYLSFSLIEHTQFFLQPKHAQNPSLENSQTTNSNFQRYSNPITTFENRKPKADILSLTT